MDSSDLIVDFSTLDLSDLVADTSEIQKYIPQRGSMAQLTAVVYADPERGVCAGYKDIGDDEFWIPGHMPGMPLMPGVVMCEAAAQLCSFLVQRYRLMDAALLGFGGLDNVRFRGSVFPGDRLLLAAEKLRLRRTMVRCRFQGFVEKSMVLQGEMRGIAIPVEQLPKKSTTS